MQLRLPFGSARPPVTNAAPAADPRQSPRSPLERQLIVVGRRTLPVTYVRHRRARHYILRLDDDGGLRVTVPRGGSRAGADAFIREQAGWIERERYRAALRLAGAGSADESTVRLRGEELPVDIVEAAGGGRVARFGSFEVALAPGARKARPAIENSLRGLATLELPRRLRELASAHGYHVSSVSVRGQRTRWGSCSPSGRISLNWRLLQVPPAVADYVLMHELAHLRHLNHSKRFWQELERICPGHREARAWLRAHAHQVGLG